MKRSILAAALLVPTLAFGDLAGEPMVMDGDTLAFDDARIDLYGVHAPTITQSCGGDGEVWSCGWEAALFLEEQIEGRHVVCVETADTTEPMARCTADGVDLGGLMIDAGLAVRDETLGGDYAEREMAAAEAGRGIWSGPFVDPVVWADRGGCSCAARKKSIAETAERLREESEAAVQ